MLLVSLALCVFPLSCMGQELHTFHCFSAFPHLSSAEYCVRCDFSSCGSVCVLCFSESCCDLLCRQSRSRLPLSGIYVWSLLSAKKRHLCYPHSCSSCSSVVNILWLRAEHLVFVTVCVLCLFPAMPCAFRFLLVCTDSHPAPCFSYLFLLVCSLCTVMICCLLVWVCPINHRLHVLLRHTQSSPTNHQRPPDILVDIFPPCAHKLGDTSITDLFSAFHPRH